MDFYSTLTEFFPNCTQEQILETIDYVNSDDGIEDPEEFRLERMIEILLEEGQDDGQLQPHDEGAVGFTQDDSRANVLKDLLQKFPNACPKHVEGFVGTGMSYDEIVSEFETNGYVMKPRTLEKVHVRLMEMLPKVDPDYLRDKAENFIFTPDNDLVQYVNNILDMEDLPTIDDYNKRHSDMMELEKYTTKFTVQAFLKEIPDPIKFFEDPDRKHALIPKNPPDENYQTYLLYAQMSLHNIYLKLDSRAIDACLKFVNYDIVKSGKKLDSFPRAYRNDRTAKEIPQYKKGNILLLKELAFVKHKKEILEVLNKRETLRQKKVKQARDLGLLETCQCCCVDELIPEECLFCIGGCVFCLVCVKVGTETAIGDGKTLIRCFNDCGNNFSPVTLQHVLDPVTFFRLEQRRQIEDIREANIDNFETCPFCDFGTVTNPEDKIFYCEGPDCGKESCRLCQHESHIPLKCSEIEYDEDVKLRTHIENKMTEALVRVCKKCSKKIVKETGCNKMTCTCGTTMCYVCKASGIDYTHFQNGSCQLHIDQRQLHLQDVLNAVGSAKQELGIVNNPDMLKFDPSRGIETEIK